MRKPYYYLVLISADLVDILHLPGVSSHLAAVVYDFQDWWSRNHHQSLLVCAGCLPCLVHRKLDLPLLFWGILWLYCHCSWMRPNSAILRLLLLVHYKRWRKVNTQLMCRVWLKNSSCWYVLQLHESLILSRSLPLRCVQCGWVY